MNPTCGICNFRSLFGLVALFAFSSCDVKVQGRESQGNTLPTPTPEIASIPIATPEIIVAPLVTPTPIPELKKRVAPEGIMFVRKSFSVSTEEGITGFPIGSEVRVLKTDGPILTVVGIARPIQSEQPASSFTNDLDEVDQLLGKAASVAQSQADSARQNLELRNRIEAEANQKLVEQQAAEKLAREKADSAAAWAEYDSLKKRVYAARKEIRTKKSTNSMAALSPDASQIEALQIQLDSMKSRLGRKN